MWPSSVPLEDVVRTPVTIDETAVYVGDFSGHVTAVELSSGELRWSKDIGSSIAGAVTVDGDRALVATVGEQQTPGGGGRARSFDGRGALAHGRGRDPAGTSSRRPVVADGMILVFEPGSVIALEAAEGGFLWRSEIVNPLRPTPFSPRRSVTMAPVSADGTVYVVDGTGRAYGLDAETGTVLWDQALNDPSPLTPPVLTDAHLLVPTNSG